MFLAYQVGSSKLQDTFREWNAQEALEAFFLKEEGLEEEVYEAVVPTSIPTGSSLYDKPVSKSLDLTMDLLPSSPDISRIELYQFKELRSKVYNSNKTSLYTLSSKTKDLEEDGGHQWPQGKLQASKSEINRGEKIPDFGEIHH